MAAEGPSGIEEVNDRPREVTDWRLVLRRQLSLLVERNAEHAVWGDDYDEDTISSRTNEMGRLLDQFRRLLIEDPTAALEMQSDLVKRQNDTDDIIKRRIKAAQRSAPASSGDQRRPSSSTATADMATVETVDARSTNSLVTVPSSSGIRERGVGEHDPSSQPAPEKRRSFSFPRRSWLSRIILGKENKNTQYRDLWSTQVEFFLSCLGFMVGTGNIWRFPSKVYMHGGGAFLIPYFISLAGLGLPIVYLHLCLGQYSGLSASGVFTKMMPLGSGIGWTLVVGAVPLCIYYNITVAWGLYYLWYSLKGFVSSDSTLPWAKCTPEWVRRFNCCDLHGSSECFANNYSMMSAEAFFHFQMLNRTTVRNITSNMINGTIPKPAELGPLQTHIVLALTVAWILTFFCVFHGIGSIGWAVYFTTTVPYLLLIILLFRGLSLNGASEGVSFFLKPDLEKIWKTEVWKSAAEQAFYSLGIDAGPLITMASYSRFRNNIYRDAVLLVTFDTLTSLLCGTVIFSFVGFLAQQQGKAVRDLLQHDSLYLAFTAYPGVTSYLEWGPLWAVLFFAMVILAAMDSEFAWIEMIAASLMEKAENRDSRLETKIIVALCIFCFLCGLPFCARGGIFIFHAIENFSGNWGAFTLTLAQIVVVVYVYGVDNFLKDIGRMQQSNESIKLPKKLTSPSACLQRLRTFFGPTGPYIKWSWLLFSPVILISLLVASASNYQRVTFNGVVLPYGYEMVAWITMVGPLIFVPLAAIYFYQYAKTNGKPISWLFSSDEWCNIRTPDDLNEFDCKEVRRATSGAANNCGTLAIESSSEDDEPPSTWHSTIQSTASTSFNNRSLRLRSISGYASSAGRTSADTSSMELPILNPLHFARSTASTSTSGSSILRPDAIRPYVRNPRAPPRPTSICSSTSSLGRRIAIANSNDHVPLSPYWQGNVAKRPKASFAVASASNYHPPSPLSLFGTPPLETTESKKKQRRYSPDGLSIPPEPAQQLHISSNQIPSVSCVFGQPPPMFIAIDRPHNQLSNPEAVALEQSERDGGNDE
uniref:Transporter n=1 Tax=Plectus sambesii TaxID=2011161 RepID=A0A914VKH7_9BILA